MRLVTLGAAALVAPFLCAQPRVDPINLHERAIILMPVGGTGSYQDPKRPLLLPPPGAARIPGLISFTWEPSDDGKLAIVEIVAKNKAALRPFLTDTRVVKAFEKGKATPDDIEKELRKYKKDYRFLKPTLRRPQ